MRLVVKVDVGHAAHCPTVSGLLAARSIWGFKIDNHKAVRGKNSAVRAVDRFLPGDVARTEFCARLNRALAAQVAYHERNRHLP